jgi:hypothetical protein
VAAAIVGDDLVTAGGEQNSRVPGTVEPLNLFIESWSAGPSVPIPVTGWHRPRWS